MFSATVLRIDNTILVDETEIQGQQAKRGSGDGQVWRGVFSVPPDHLRPTMGETITLLLDDDSKVAAVVTEVVGRTVHFRASGRMPTLTEA